MRFFHAAFFVLSCIQIAFSQNEKTAEYYYSKGLKTSKDGDLRKKGLRPFKEAFPYFFKASELAKEGSELQLKAIYHTVYLYNYAKQEEMPVITKRTIQGLRYIRKLDKRDSFSAEYHFRAGLAFMRDYRPDSAIYILEEAKGIFQALHGDYSVKISDCYHAIGDVYKGVLSDYNSAETFYEKALVVAERAKDNELSRFMISKLYQELASVNSSQHDYEKALAYGLKSIAFIESLPSKKYHTNQELAYANVAGIYSNMGSLSKAENLYHKAISLNKDMNKDTRDSYLGDFYFGLADAFKKAGKTDHAIANYLEAINIFENASGPKDVLQVKNYQRLGEAYLLMTQMPLSLLNFRKGVLLLDDFELQKSGQASELYLAIGKYFRLNHKTDSSLVYYQKALIAASHKFKSLKFRSNPLREDIRLNDFAYEALLEKGSLLAERYNETQDVNFLNAALASFDLSEKLLVDSRAKLDMDNSKWSFFDANFGLYQQALSLLNLVNEKQLNDTLVKKAFYYMESSKSKMLADAFNETEFTIPLLASDSIVRFLDFQRRNSYQLQDEFKRQEGKPAEQARIRDLIIDTDRKIQRAENDIAGKYPSYIKTKYQYDIPALAELQDLSQEREIAIIEYFWGLDEVFGLAINKDKVSFKRLGSTDSIQSVLTSVHDMLTLSKYSYDSDEINSFERNANLSYQLLVLPFESVIEKEARLIVLPDGPIEQIPFEILVSKTTAPSSQKNFSSINYLLRRHIISYSFSSSYLLNQSVRGLVNPKMLAFGFTAGKGLRSGSERTLIKEQKQLPGAELELKTILGVFPEGEYHYGNEVTEELFKKEAPGFDLIHLAVHGMGDTEQNYSASLFFRDSVTSKEDGRLHWYELFGLRLKAKLAVISSCESGIGKSYRGEGMLSMASAFAFAGCKNIVMGLWKVDDRVSSDLMTDFYENLQDGKQVDIALTEAKRSYLDRADNLTANPKLWASLVSYGNGQVINKDKRLAYIGIFVIFMILICIAFYAFKRRSTHL